MRAKLGISCGTAQSILTELCDEGYLERRSTAGTFVPGKGLRFDLAHLVFNPRAKQVSGLGKLILNRLVHELDRAAIPWKLTWKTEWKGSPRSHYIVYWDVGSASLLRELVALRQHGMLLAQHVPSHHAMAFFDSISVDPFGAGVCAGEILRQAEQCKRVSILANPHGMLSWAEHAVLGFRTQWPRARIFHPRTWTLPALEKTLKTFVSEKNDGIFCCSQRIAIPLAEYYAKYDRTLPTLVTYSPPPLYLEIPTTFVTFHVDEIVKNAVRVIRHRLLGDQSPTSHINVPVYSDDRHLAGVMNDVRP